MPHLIEGVVTLIGRVESRTVADLLAMLTAEVAGVVSVIDKVAWDTDDAEFVRTTARSGARSG